LSRALFHLQLPSPAEAFAFLLFPTHLLHVLIPP
jgi:hypothetical protein